MEVFHVSLVNPKYTYELHVVEFLAPEADQGVHGVSVHREGHARQGLLLRVHTDVRLHLKHTHGLKASVEFTNYIWDSVLNS